MTEDEPARDDLTAAIGARRELGKDYEDAVVDSFVARLDQRIAERVDEQVAERLGSNAKPKARGRAPTGQAANPGFALGVVSLVSGIPITVLASENAGAVGLLVSWAGIAAVNVAHALGRRRRSD